MRMIESANRCAMRRTADQFLSFSGLALQKQHFYATAVTIVRNGWSCGSHAVYVCQGHEAPCQTRAGAIG